MVREQSNYKLRHELVAVSFIDSSYSWGPAIHYIELLNELSLLPKAPKMQVFVLLAKNDLPYRSSLAFHWTAVRFSRFSSAGKLLFDLYLFFFFLFHRRTQVYIRQSNFGVLLLTALSFRRHRVFVEMNGTAREDYHLGYRTGPKRRLAYTLRMFVERLHIKRATGVISVSKNLSKTLARRYSNIQDESRFHTVYNGCGTHFVRQAARTVRTEVIHVVFVGTFTPWDGHEKIIDLYTAVLEKGVPVHFEIAGPNVYSSILYQKLKENEHFTFYPGIDYLDLPSFYERMDAAISLAGIKRSKKVEKSTLKLLEYRAAKLPIFTTRSFGNEYVENLNIGVLVNQEEMDDPNLLGRKFVDFLENLDLYKKSYDTAPSPRTWKDAARETRDILSL